jgi:hypothetical protein
MARVEGLSADRLSHESYVVLKTIQRVRSCRLADIQRAFDDAELGLPQHDVGEMKRVAYFVCTDAAQTIFQLTEAGEAAIARHEREAARHSSSPSIDYSRDQDDVPPDHSFTDDEDLSDAPNPPAPARTPAPRVSPQSRRPAADPQRQPARTTDQRRTSSAQPAGPGTQQPSGRAANKPVAPHGQLSSSRTAPKAPPAAAPRVQSSKVSKASKPGKPKPR